MGHVSTKPLRRFIQQYSPDSRLLVAALFTILAIYLGLQLVVLALLFFFAALLLLWDALRHGTVWPAFDAFKTHRHEQLYVLLEAIRWPSLLAPRSLAYYNWLKGVQDIGAQRLAAAKIHLLAAASGPIRTETDRSLIHCLLAEVAIQQAEGEVAAEHLRHAAALAGSDNIRRLIERLQARLND